MLIGIISSFRQEGGQYLTISGGEPGLRRDLPDLISEAANLGLKVTLYTNGLAVTPEVLESVKKSSGILALSIDGPDANTHEEMRGKGTFAPAVANFEKAIAYLEGNHVMLSCVLSRPLVSNLDKLVDFVRGYPIAALYIGMFEPLNHNILHVHSPTAEEMINPVLYLLDAFKDQEEPQLLFSESHDLININSVFSIRSQEKILGRTVKVQADGWAYPGPFFYDPRFRLGRPTEQGWLTVWQSHVYEELLEQARNRIHMVKKCSQCFWSYRCGGGSLALTWAVYGKWQETCPLCELYQATLERAARRYLSNESAAGTG